VGPLEGVVVLEVGLLIQGPQAAALLVDWGADVIKVEYPGWGDQARWMPVGPESTRSAFFEAMNRGKRSVTLDLRRPEGRDVFLRMAERADVGDQQLHPGRHGRVGCRVRSAVRAESPAHLRRRIQLWDGR
jgi:crotonobetainyl-CoA:carnitine CoA-transferase CaiB-like acyl-CoA transferase